jgi:hypothetical protein
MPHFKQPQTTTEVLEHVPVIVDGQDNDAKLTLLVIVTIYVMQTMDAMDQQLLTVIAVFHMLPGHQRARVLVIKVGVDSNVSAT